MPGTDNRQHVRDISPDALAIMRGLQQTVQAAMVALQVHSQDLQAAEKALTQGDPSLVVDLKLGAIMRRPTPAPRERA